MKVFQLIGTPTTAPKTPGVFLRGGDVCDPQDGEQLNGPPWPTRATRFHCPLPVLPFICFVVPRWAERFLPQAARPLEGKRSGVYAGWKVYGFDSPTYAKWCDGKFAADVFKGSLAMELTIRTFRDG